MTLLIPQNYTRGALYAAVANELDIPEALADRAHAEYKRLGDYLCADATLAPYVPHVYPQGSFRLGTAIKPVSDQDDYDIDCVCRVQMVKENVTQAELKALIGDALKRSPEYRRIMKEGRRCWTLNFPDGFHLDVLPSLPNPLRIPHGILITDTELFRWQMSNPVGYADWFKKRQEPAFLRERDLVAKALNVDAVPEYRVRTPLQRAVQLLKRHRDQMFSERAEDKPISIILTTLAAHAYDNSEDLETAMQRIVDEMPKYVERRHGVAWIQNPVDEGENFADKWQQHPEREAAFYDWHARLSAQVSQVFKSVGVPDASKGMEYLFGRAVTERALRNFGESMRSARDAGRLHMAPRTGLLSIGTSAAGNTAVPRHTFYGSDAPDR